MGMKEPNRQQWQVRRLQRRLWLERTLFALVLLPLCTLWLFPRLSTGRAAICVDGQPIAIVADRATAERALKAAKEERAGNVAEAKFARPVTVTRAGRGDGPAISESEAARRVLAAVPVLAPRATILVDGRPVAALPLAYDANAALDMVKAHYAAATPDLVAEPTFKEQVTVASRVVPADLWLPDAKAAAARLIEARGEPAESHAVSPGDTAEAIAARYQISLDALQRYNPGLRLTRLRVGDLVSVQAPPAPPITVVVRARVARVPRELRTAKLRRGPAEVTYENGVAVSATRAPGTADMEMRVAR
jgi:hypothetical protein